MRRFFLVAAMMAALVAGAQTSRSDVNRDGQINSADVVEVYKTISEGVEDEIDYSGTRVYHVRNGAPIVLVGVEGGTFQMGATSEQHTTMSNEYPVHEVTLNSFFITDTEVTQELWKAVMGEDSNPSWFVGDYLPVNYVSWDKCQEFIQELNDMFRSYEIDYMRFRLPTEAEWEYAARGGNRSKGYVYSGSNNYNNVAHVTQNSTSPYTVADRNKYPNELGLYEMSGNVEEWCSDWYGEYSDEAQTNPTGPESGTERVVRGGNVRSTYWMSRVAYRGSRLPNRPDLATGFRLVLSK